MGILVTVGFSFLSAFLQVLFDRLSSRSFVQFLQGNESVYDQLEELKILLLSVNAYINKAEEQQIGGVAVREWLSELEEAIFEAADLVDEINTRALSSRNVTVAGVQDIFKGTKFKVTRIIKRIEFIIRQKDFLGLQERSFRAPRSTPFEDESTVFGRDSDKINVLAMLKSDESPVISIVGMGGIGKTTLVQMVYNDGYVKRFFHHRAWIVVSEDFDVFMLTKAIFEAVTGQTCVLKDLYSLQAQLNLTLRMKKFLFVLDDVWNENYIYWNILKSPLESGAPGSKIILTTRSEKVASMMSNASTYRLRELPDSCSRSLFVKHAFEDEDLTLGTYPELRSVTDQVVIKCKGHPLAIKSLAGLLRFEVNKEEWDKILTSNLWELSEKEQNILPALWLSYCHLPPYLRQCFAYCSIFPKNYKMNIEQLVWIWMAEDLLFPQNGRRIEDIGEEYIRILVSRSLLQSSTDEPKIVTMHDLVHDMAIFVSRRSCQILSDDNSSILESKARYLSFTNGCISAREGIEKFQYVLSNKKNLRSFLPFGKTKPGMPMDSFTLKSIPEGQRLRAVSLSRYKIATLPSSIDNLKHLRYFDISYATFTHMPDSIGTLLNLQTLLLKSCSNLAQLPDSIGKLESLRYLDLSRTAVKKIPDAISKLSNLQTLLLSTCGHLKQLPTNMKNLTGLRHLDISQTSLKHMPPEMSRLKGLRTLTNFVVGKEGVEDSRSPIEELKSLDNIQGSLEISGLENVVVRGDALKDTLREKKHLDKLLVEWKSHTDDSNIGKEVLIKLQPHINLKELSIKWYNGGRFPDWVGDGSFSKMISVSLTGCKHCFSLPPLGHLPSLEVVTITKFYKLERIGDEFYSNGTVSEPFKSLKVLYFDDMPLWHTWSLAQGSMQGEAFPRLEQLNLLNCGRLDTNCLPGRLRDIMVIS